LLEPDDPIVFGVDRKRGARVLVDVERNAIHAPAVETGGALVTQSGQALRCKLQHDRHGHACSDAGGLLAAFVDVGVGRARDLWRKRVGEMDRAVEIDTGERKDKPAVSTLLSGCTRAVLRKIDKNHGLEVSLGLAARHRIGRVALDAGGDLAGKFDACCAQLLDALDATVRSHRAYQHGARFAERVFERALRIRGVGDPQHNTGRRER
jgi:hypothetical protein